VKHWQKLFFTGATNSHPCRSHGLNDFCIQPETGDHRRSIHALHRLCRELSAYGPTLRRWDMDIKTQA